MIAYFNLYAALVGLFVLLYRLQPWKQATISGTFSEKFGDQPLVSILVPCRNEARNLPTLLASLAKVDYENFELIIIDDQSTDETYKIACGSSGLFKRFTVVQAPPRPPGWVGKNWACHFGAERAQGDYLLFTDADTEHFENSLRESLGFLREGQYGLVSAPPFHACQNWWEKIIGSFHMIPLIAGAYRHKPTEFRLFAIGQYLLFSREAYQTCGGHERLSNSLAEDVELAKAVLSRGLKYGVYSNADIFQVQMYRSFQEFLAGWTRLLRIGLRESRWQSTAEVALSLNVLGFCIFRSDLRLVAIGLAGVLTLLLWQTRFGKFITLGAFLAPIGAWLFCLVTVRSLFDVIRRSPVVWKGRRY